MYLMWLHLSHRERAPDAKETSPGNIRFSHTHTHKAQTHQPRWKKSQRYYTRLSPQKENPPCCGQHPERDWSFPLDCDWIFFGKLYIYTHYRLVRRLSIEPVFSHLCLCGPASGVSRSEGRPQDPITVHLHHLLFISLCIYICIEKKGEMCKHQQTWLILTLVTDSSLFSSLYMILLTAPMEFKSRELWYISDFFWKTWPVDRRNRKEKHSPGSKDWISSDGYHNETQLEGRWRRHVKWCTALAAVFF